MKLNIQCIYTKICLSLLKVLDPFEKPIGRPNKYTYDFYIKHILHILTSGLSWNKLSSIISINTDLIRKKYIKWCKLGLFTKANKIILSQYKKKYNHNCLYIDSTNIANFTGKLDFGYNIKIKNKRSIKINQHKFVDNCDEIKYIYYKLNSMFQHVDNMCVNCMDMTTTCSTIRNKYDVNPNCTDTLNSFKLSQLSMSDFYNLMIQLFVKTPKIISVPCLKVDNNKILDDTTDDEFQDASDKKSSDENSNKYNDSYTIYKKTMKNTTQRRINTGK